ncbi:MAG: hypothetical protein H0T72_10470 [Chloroflexia bacterium]|nr:hypothetical protein [Chloroflexia bacterium]
MTLDSGVSTELAVLLTLLAASMWGTWMVSLKYIGDFPLDGFVVTLYTSSFIFVWGVALIVERGDLLKTLANAARGEPARVLGVLAGGIAFAVGMGVTLTVLSRIGLSVAQPIQSSVSIMLGTAITVVVGGVPDGVSLARLLIAVAILTGAVIVTMLAAWFRAQAWRQTETPDVVDSMKHLWRSLPLIVLASLLSAAYPWALSIGLKSPTQSEGFDVLPYMVLLVTGALMGSLLINGITLTRRRQWRQVLEAPFRIRRWGMMSGVFHFGGNIIHSVGTASLSASIAYPLGLSAAFWTLLWALLHGEFKGASMRAHVALATAMDLYCTGVAIIISTL